MPAVRVVSNCCKVYGPRQGFPLQLPTCCLTIVYRKATVLRVGVRWCAHFTHQLYPLSSLHAPGITKQTSVSVSCSLLRESFTQKLCRKECLRNCISGTPFVLRLHLVLLALLALLLCLLCLLLLPVLLLLLRCTTW